MASQKPKLHFDNVYTQQPLVLDLIEVYQAGECYTQPDFEEGDHRQWCDEISYILSGEALFVVNGKQYPVKAGDLIFCPNDSVHNIISSSTNPARYFYVGYQFIETHPRFKQWRSVARGLSHLKEYIYHNAFQMIRLFFDLLSEFQHHSPNRELMIEAILLQMIVYAHRCFSGTSDLAAVYEGRVPNKEELAHMITRYIDKNITRIRSLKDVSNYIGFSYSYTAQIFSRYTGMSLKAYYQEKRFEEALKLLQNGLRVTQVAEILGFESIDSFSRAFKARYRLSPHSYIKQKNTSESTSCSTL